MKLKVFIMHLLLYLPILSQSYIGISTSYGILSTEKGVTSGDLFLKQQLDSTNFIEFRCGYAFSNELFNGLEIAVSIKKYLERKFYCFTGMGAHINDAKNSNSIIVQNNTIPFWVSGFELQPNEWFNFYIGIKIPIANRTIGESKYNTMNSFGVVKLKYILQTGINVETSL